MRLFGYRHSPDWGLAWFLGGVVCHLVVALLGFCVTLLRLVSISKQKDACAMSGPASFSWVIYHYFWTVMEIHLYE